MEHNKTLRAGHAYLYAGPQAGALLVQLAAQLALEGRVIVLDAGGGFNAYRAARAIRLQTAALFEIQGRISVARAFTAHEVLRLLRQTPATEAPVLIFDLLATFEDEAVTVIQRHHLLSRCIGEIRRLQERAPVVVGLRHDGGRELSSGLQARLQQALEPLDLEVFMGKTTPTINDLLREMEAAMGRFRRVLHPAEKAQFDRLYVKARKHIAAIGEAAYLLPLEAVQLAIAFEQEKENQRRDERLDRIERRLNEYTDEL